MCNPLRLICLHLLHGIVLVAMRKQRVMPSDLAGFGGDSIAAVLLTILLPAVSPSKSMTPRAWTYLQHVVFFGMVPASTLSNVGHSEGISTLADLTHEDVDQCTNAPERVIERD